MSEGTKINHPDRMLMPPEVKITLMALAGLIEDIEATLKKQQWKSQAKYDLEDMLKVAKSAKTKLEYHTTGGKEMKLPDYNEGDKKEFLE